MAALHWGW